jgi:hypothetical protein
VCADEFVLYSRQQRVDASYIASHFPLAPTKESNYLLPFHGKQCVILIILYISIIILMASLAILHQYNVTSVQVGFLIQMWVCSVAYFSGAIVASPDAKPPLSPTKRRLKPDNNCRAFISHHWCLWLFMGTVLTTLIIAFLASFLAFPEAQTSPLSCRAKSPPLKLSDLASGNETSMRALRQIPSYGDSSAASHVVSISTGLTVSEATAVLCSAVIRVRLLKNGDGHEAKGGVKPHAHWRSIEVDVLTRVDRGSEIFLRLDLDNLLATTSSSAAKAVRHLSHVYTAMTSDGWWQMSREYDWYSPLSANFRPVSSAVSFLISTLQSPTAADASTPAVSARSTTGKFTFTPSHPLGMALHRGQVDMTLHRSLRVDDEKGLQEAMRDTTRSFTAFKIEQAVFMNEVDNWARASAISSGEVDRMNHDRTSHAGDQLVVYASDITPRTMNDR